MEGWEDRGEGSRAADGAATGALDLDAFDSADELEMLGGCCLWLQLLNWKTPHVSACWHCRSSCVLLHAVARIAGTAGPHACEGDLPLLSCCPVPGGLRGAACAGAERLKEALQALGLKCGGTLRQRAERLMLTKGKRLEDLDKSLFAKGAAPAVSDPGDKSLQMCPVCSWL